MSSRTDVRSNDHQLWRLLLVILGVCSVTQDSELVTMAWSIFKAAPAT